MTYERFQMPKGFQDLRADQADEYMTAASNHYSYSYPYHNWNHALAVIDGINRIADKLENKGVTIARHALSVAAAWHDAGYHRDHTKPGHSTKEEYSAALLDQYLQKRLITRQQNHLMRSSIIGTLHAPPIPRTPPQILLHRADTANIGGPADEFIKNGILLLHEADYRGQSVTWQTHVERTVQFVDTLILEHDTESLSQNVGLEDSTVDVYDQAFGKTALQNIAALQAVQASDIN